MPRTEWQYTADDGTVYKRLADDFLTGQTVLGGATAAGTEPTMGRDWKPRTVEVIDASGDIREVIAYAPSAPIYTSNTHINLHLANASHAYHSNGHWRGEQPPRRYHK